MLFYFLKHLYVTKCFKFDKNPIVLYYFLSFYSLPKPFIIYFIESHINLTGATHIFITQILIII